LDAGGRTVTIYGANLGVTIYGGIGFMTYNDTGTSVWCIVTPVNPNIQAVFYVVGGNYTDITALITTGHEIVLILFYET